MAAAIRIGGRRTGIGRDQIRLLGARHTQRRQIAILIAAAGPAATAAPAGPAAAGGFVFRRDGLRRHRLRAREARHSLRHGLGRCLSGGGVPGGFILGGFAGAGLIVASSPPAAAAAAAAFRVLAAFAWDGRVTGGGVLGGVDGIFGLVGLDDVVFLGLDRLGRRQQRRAGGIGSDEARFLARHDGAQAFDAEARRDHRIVGGDDGAHAVPALDLIQPFALVVEDVQRDRCRDMNDDLGGAALARFFLDPAQYVQRGAFGAAHMTRAIAVLADDEGGFLQRRAQPLAAHFQQAEMADVANLDAGAVVLQRLLQPALDHGVVAFRLHVDEVDDDQPGQIAQAQLPRHLIRRFEVGADGGFLDIAFAGRAAGVHVDGDQRLGLVDHQIAAGAQLHRRLHHRVELRFHLETGEQRLPLIRPVDDLAGVRGHQHPHELMRRAPARLPVHGDVVDVARIDIADRAFDEAGFLVDHRGGDGFQRVIADVVPEAQQILAIALDLGLGALRPGGAHDQAHALWHVEFGHDLLQAAAVGGGGDFPGYPAPARRVRHQHGEPAGEREIRGQRRALGAAFLLHHLDQQDLAAVDDFLDLVVTQEARREAAFGPFGGVVVIAVAADGLGRRFLGDRAEHVQLVAGVGTRVRVGVGVGLILVHFLCGGMGPPSRVIFIGSVVRGETIPLVIFRAVLGGDTLRRDRRGHSPESGGGVRRRVHDGGGRVRHGGDQRGQRGQSPGLGARSRGGSRGGSRGESGGG